MREPTPRPRALCSRRRGLGGPGDRSLSYAREAVQRPAGLLAALGLASLAFDLASVAVKLPLGATPFTAGDLVEATGVFVVAALYAAIAVVLAQGEAPRPDRRAHTTRLRSLLLFGIVLYALGRGAHLASNSISDALVRSGGADPWGVVYFWDETFSHYAVDAARATLALVLTAAERARAGAGDASGGGSPRSIAATIGSLAYGFTYFASAVEGQTLPLALPFSLGYAIWGLARRSRAGLVQRFFTAAAFVSLLLFATWFLWQGGFPEFTRAGLLPTPKSGT